MIKFSFELIRKEMISSNDRLYFRAKASLTAHLRLIARLETVGKVNAPFSPKKPCGVNVTFLAPTKRKYDPPNFYPTIKALIDGMTDAKVWTDDNHEVIKYMKFEHGGLSGGKYYVVVIEIEEIKNER